jgi:hypothetical protein
METSYDRNSTDKRGVDLALKAIAWTGIIVQLMWQLATFSVIVNRWEPRQAT